MSIIFVWTDIPIGANPYWYLQWWFPGFNSLRWAIIFNPLNLSHRIADISLQTLLLIPLSITSSIFALGSRWAYNCHIYHIEYYKFLIPNTRYDDDNYQMTPRNYWSFIDLYSFKFYYSPSDSASQCNHTHLNIFTQLNPSIETGLTTSIACLKLGSISGLDVGLYPAYFISWIQLNRNLIVYFSFSAYLFLTSLIRTLTIWSILWIIHPLSPIPVHSRIHVILLLSTL